VQTCIIGLGANIGRPLEAIETAISAIDREPGVRVTACSALYRSAPVDARGPDFLNAVIRVETTLPPADLLAVMQRIEQAAGRERPYRNAPRSLDLDLLLVDEVVLETPTLTLPHPRMHLRAFVLRPLIDIEPEQFIPGKGSARKLLDLCGEQPIEQVGTIGLPGPGMAT
jgi:2-amino-4-hydroxy-6-hydroxymethyldihydropteridine diphosphokinase